MAEAERERRYAVVECGAKQHRVEEGQWLEVERLPQALGARVELERVLLLGVGAETRVGRPVVPGARVVCRVAGHTKGPKIRVFTYKAKSNERRRRGHRQALTRLVVEQIVGGGGNGEGTDGA